MRKRLFVHYEALGQLGHACFILLLICGGAYLLAWVLMFTPVPRIGPIQLAQVRNS
ncbi:hypothetical protein HHL22_08345 [Hymenobacter sp. RP-2-7]|uniref:Uncharacterized protein n=1 Tax=Hymenobacter polaris TaxID=2682546 RepID=A0A7Y0ADQ1_9BACT|nr:hypothetical protein [Hymenobacter polaris]NML65210.1 hypothetical protein [Hymenobacter polaris]